MELEILKGKKVAELREIAKALKIEGADKLKKKEIVDILERMHQEAEAEKAAAAEKAKQHCRDASTFRCISYIHGRNHNPIKYG